MKDYRARRGAQAEAEEYQGGTTACPNLGMYASSTSPP
jgi:hypothetical protein